MPREDNMREKMITIRIPAVPRKAWLMGVVVGVLAIGAGAWAFNPFDLTDPVAGTPVGANMFKMNNQAIKDKVNELQTVIAKPIYTNPSTKKQYSLQATYCGSTASTTGLVNDPPSAKGIASTKSLCEKACSNSPSAHMCTVAEVQRYIATGGSFTANASWYSAGLWTYDGGKVVNDCVSWTSADVAIEGPVSYPSDPAHGEACNASHPILCCD
jgi:hypothetical protein